MQEAKVRLITHETCTKPYVYGTRVTDDMICAGHLQGNVDACQVSAAYGHSGMSSYTSLILRSVVERPERIYVCDNISSPV